MLGRSLAFLESSASYGGLEGLGDACDVALIELIVQRAEDCGCYGNFATRQDANVGEQLRLRLRVWLGDGGRRGEVS